MISALFSPKIWIPDSVEEAWKMKQEIKDDAIFIAGGTYLQTNWSKGKAYPAHLISLERIKEIQGMVQKLVGDQMVWQLGALSTIYHCRHLPQIIQNIPLLADAAKTIGAPAIRNRATIGGNIAYGFGDTIPALLAMNTAVSFFNGKSSKTVALLDYLKEKSKGILLHVFIPIKSYTATDIVFFHKLGLREAFSPAIVTVSGYCRMNKQGEVEEILLALVGADTPPQRLIECEQMLLGSLLKDQNWKHVHHTITEELNQIPDSPFASADYKRLAAANIIISELAKRSG